MKITFTVSLLLLATLLLGCQTKPEQHGEVHNAVLTTSSAATIKQLKQAIVTLTGGMPPKLATTVFQRSPHLILEHGNSKQADGAPILGNHELDYDSFTLQLRGTLCVLYYPKKQTFVPLQQLSCEATTN